MDNDNGEMKSLVIDDNEVMTREASKQENTRYHYNANGMYVLRPGVSGNPGGRPKGISLKEYGRAYLAKMTDEEKLEWMKDLPKEVIWRMCEGNPHQSSDTTTRREEGHDLISISLLNNLINTKKPDRIDTIEVKTELLN